MTTETNSVLNSVKEAFAPVTEAFTKLQNMDVPEAAREFVKKQALPSYCRELQSLKIEEAEEEQAKDEVYEQAKDLVLSTGQASASLIQRRLRVGYPRAARMIEQMEAEGVVGAAGRDGRREVLGRRGPVGGDEV